MNKNINQIAEKIIRKSNIPEENFGSVILALMVISIVVSAIRVIQECNKDNKNNTSHLNGSIYKEQIKSLSIRKGWFTRMRLKKIVRQYMKKEEYKNYGSNLTEAILTVGENISEDETLALLQYMSTTGDK